MTPYPYFQNIKGAHMKQVMSLIRVLLIGSASITLSAGNCLGAEPDATAAIVKQMVAAIVADDHDAFVAHGDAELKSADNNEILKTINPRLLVPLKKGYEISYLGIMKVQGYDVTLWRITYKAGGDDSLVTLYMKNGIVGGFWLK
jgi:hypothetical protein